MTSSGSRTFVSANIESGVSIDSTRFSRRCGLGSTRATSLRNRWKAFRQHCARLSEPSIRTRPEAADNHPDMTLTIPTTSLADPVTYRSGVPYEEFARRRREAPVAWVDEVPLHRHGSRGGRSVHGSGYWAVTRYATIVAVSRQPETFSSAIRGAFLADPVSRDDLERTRQLLINMDAPQHTTVRQLVTTAFSPRAANR